MSSLNILTFFRIITTVNLPIHGELSLTNTWDWTQLASVCSNSQRRKQHVCIGGGGGNLKWMHFAERLKNGKQ